MPEIAAASGITMIEPIGYIQFMSLVQKSRLVITDSGGIQEEATALGRPMLVMRDVTERPEAIAAGGALLVGAHSGPIVEQASALLTDRALYRRMSAGSDVFGDGHAARRIVDALEARRR